MIYVNTQNVDETDENSDFTEETPKVDKLTVEELIALKCDKYDVPYDIALAIAKLDTGHFTSDAFLEGNNPGGMSIDEVPIEYNSIDEGVNAFVLNLADNYFGQGLTTAKEIGKKYCPCNNNWARTVEKIMEEQNRYE